MQVGRVRLTVSPVWSGPAYAADTLEPGSIDTEKSSVSPDPGSVGAGERARELAGGSARSARVTLPFAPFTADKYCTRPPLLPFHRTSSPLLPFAGECYLVPPILCSFLLRSETQSSPLLSAAWIPRQITHCTSKFLSNPCGFFAIHSIWLG